MKIKIITDSTADLTPEIIRKYDIDVLPLIVNFEDRSYVDGIEISPSQFYEKMRHSKKLPTTSQVPMQIFTEAYEKHLAEYDHIVGIFLSSVLSGTFQTALIMAEKSKKERIHLIDSGEVTLSLGLLVLEAAKKNAQQPDIEELLSHIRGLIPRIRLRAIVGSLDNLKKGGRLSAASAMLATALAIKPIIHTKEGLVDVIHKARGEKNALKWLLDDFAQGADLSYGIVIGHSACAEKAQLLREEVLSRSGISAEILTELGAVVGTHAGEGCFGLAYIAGK